MTQRSTRKFTVGEYMALQNKNNYQLLDGDLVPNKPSIARHQAVLLKLFLDMKQFIDSHKLGQVFHSPCTVILSNYDVVRPDIVYVSAARSSIIGDDTVMGTPDLVAEVLSPETAELDRGYKRNLYNRHGVMEYWLADPDTQTVEILADSDAGLVHHATFHKGQPLTSPLLDGLTINLEHLFR